MLQTQLKFVHIGMDNIICANRVTAIITPNTKTGKRYMKRAKQANTFIDGTLGRRTRSLLIIDDGQVMASCINTKTLMNRFMAEGEAAVKLDKEMEEQAAREAILAAEEEDDE